MKEVVIDEVESNITEIIDEILENEIFTICDVDGQPLMVFVPYTEYIEKD